MKKFNIFFVLLIFLSFNVISQNERAVLIGWDASFSMKDRDIAKEFQFLENYIESHEGQFPIQLVVFSDVVISDTYFDYSDEMIKEIKDYLFTVPMDGTTNYNSIKNYSAKNFPNVLIFTDGKEIGDKIPKFESATQVMLISSSESSDAQKLAIYMKTANTFFVDLYRQQPQIAAEKLIENDKVFFEMNNRALAKPKGKKVVIKKVEGKTYMDDRIIPNVLVTLEGTQRFTVSDSLGNYSIAAEEGDILQFSHDIMGSKKINVTDSDLDVNLNYKIIDLDEVLVVEEKEKKKMVLTGTGYRDSNSIGYSVSTISTDQISGDDLEIGNTIQGKVAGVEVGGGANPGQRSNIVNASDMTIRGLSFVGVSNQPLIIVDGTPMESSSLTSTADQNRADYGIIDPGNVKEITVLKSLAATARYGDRGANGVILITTKTGQGLVAGENISEYDKTKKLLGINNDYQLKALTDNFEVKTDYLLQLKNAQNIEEAYNLYLNIRNAHYKNPVFFIDVYDFFKESNDEKLADRVLGNIVELFNDDATALRQMGFKLIDEKDYENALKAFKRIKELNPNNAQSYLDLATNLKQLKRYNDALAEYEHLIAPQNATKFQYTDLKKIVVNEIKNLYYHHKGKLKLNNQQTFYSHNAAYDARIILNWSKPDTYFEIDFVDPNNKFFKWSYSPQAPESTIDEDKIYGLTTEEFQLIDAEEGEWNLNLKYLGNDENSESPSFLIVKVYYNFGKPNQKLDSKLVRLSEIGSEINLIKINL